MAARAVRWRLRAVFSIGALGVGVGPGRSGACAALAEAAADDPPELRVGARAIGG